MKYVGCALIIKDNKILGVTRKTDHSDWGLPGGKLEEGIDKSIADCAIRETLEETGIIIEKIDYDFVFKRYDNNFMSCTFLVTEYSGEINHNEEHLCDWITSEQLLTGSFSEYNSDMLNFYKSKIK